MRKKLFVFFGLGASWLAFSPSGFSAADECPAEGVRIKASDPDPFDTFGRAVSIWGDTAVVGAFWDNQNGPDSGAAYVFARENLNWVQTHKLLSSDGVSEDEFGKAVGLQGDHLLIAALQHIHDDQSGNGSVYAFSHRETGWSESQELLASDGQFGAGFGRSLAISGDTAIIGAPSFDDDDNFIFGVAFVFRRDPQTMDWIEEAQLLQPDLPNIPGLGQGFGSAVALSADIAVIAMAGDDSACPEDPICDSGAAYVFRYDAEAQNWFEEQKLLASDATWGDNFGRGVAVSGDVVLIGAPDHDENGSFSGAVYVFGFDPETSQWVERQTLVASDGLPGDQFGRALAMDGDLAVIGAWLADPVGNSSGAAYAFRRGPDGVWTEECKLLPEPNATTQIFGKAIAVDCGRVIIGSKGEDNQSGAAYIYELSTNPADLNGDCDVGAFDLAQLLASWGPCPKLCTPGDPANTCPADLNGDCTVGPADLAMLLGSWGT